MPKTNFLSTDFDSYFGPANPLYTLYPQHNKEVADRRSKAGHQDESCNSAEQDGPKHSGDLAVGVVTGRGPAFSSDSRHPENGEPEAAVESSVIDVEDVAELPPALTDLGVNR